MKACAAAISHGVDMVACKVHCGHNCDGDCAVKRLQVRETQLAGRPSVYCNSFAPLRVKHTQKAASYIPFSGDRVACMAACKHNEQGICRVPTLWMVERNAAPRVSAICSSFLPTT